MRYLTPIFQSTWLVLTVWAFFLSYYLRRVSLSLAEDGRGQRYFRAQGRAWQGNACEIVSAFARGCAGFFLPDHPVVVLLLAVGVAGRVYQITQLNSAYNSIVNGSGISGIVNK